MNNANEKALIGASQLTDVLCMDAIALQKRSEGPAPFGAGVTLNQEEREQEQQKRSQLLVAQLDCDSQFQHGESPVYAGVHANWLVGFGSNDNLAAFQRRGKSWLLDDAKISRAGDSRAHPCGVRGSQFVMHNDQGKGRAR